MIGKPIPQELQDQNRVGDVSFDKEWLRQHQSLMDDLSDELFVVNAKQSAQTDEVLITAYCEKFEPHNNRLMMPRYSFDFEEWERSGRVLFTKTVAAKLRLNYTKVNGG
jgi:hypothetical protein